MNNNNHNHNNNINNNNNKNTALKKFVIFQEMELSSHKIRNFLLFQEGTYKA